MFNSDDDSNSNIDLDSIDSNCSTCNCTSASVSCDDDSIQSINSIELNNEDVFYPECDLVSFYFAIFILCLLFTLNFLYLFSYLFLT